MERFKDKVTFKFKLGFYDVVSTSGKIYEGIQFYEKKRGEDGYNELIKFTDDLGRERQKLSCYFEILTIQKL